MTRGCLSVCNVLCRINLVICNIVAIITGIIFVLLGGSLIWGFRLATGILGPNIREWTASITDELQASMGITIDFVQLLNDIGAVTASAGAAALIIGIIFICIGFFGCCGACCKLSPCVIVYLIGLLVIFLTQLIVVIIWFSNADVIKSGARSAMVNSLHKFVGINGTNIESLLQNVVQIFVGCCGIDNGTDFYHLAPNWNREYSYDYEGLTVRFNLTYPISCCKFNQTTFEPVDRNCIIGGANYENSNHMIGCYNEIFAFIEKYFKINSLFYAMAAALFFQCILIGGAVVFLIAESSNKIQPSHANQYTSNHMKDAKA